MSATHASAGIGPSMTAQAMRFGRAKAADWRLGPGCPADTLAARVVSSSRRWLSGMC